VLESGPLRGQLRVLATYDLPRSSSPLARGAAVPVDVVTTLELRAGEDLLRVTTALDNSTRDHRLRAWFPLLEPASRSRAECAFAVVDRGLDAEGGPSELGLPTFPSRRFVTAGGLTVAHEGLLEYELVDIEDGRARSLALTLLRCTGMLSQGPMTTRPLPAGPMTPIEGPQLQRPVEVRYALHVGGRDAYRIADDAFLPLLVTSAGGGDRPRRGSALSVTGAEVSAVQRTAGRLEVRVFNPSSATTTVTVDERAGWLVDLRGRPVQPFESSFELAPWRIATIVLND
jgi:alpha-mannosidase